MRIYTKEMLSEAPSKNHCIDDVTDRNYGDKQMSCASIAIVNTLCFYGISYDRTPTLQDMLQEANDYLEATNDGGVSGKAILSFLMNENLGPEVIVYPREIDLFEAVADCERIALLIIHIGDATHVQTLRRGPRGRFQLGTIELSLDQLLNICEERQSFITEQNIEHHSPSVLIKLKRRVS